MEHLTRKLAVALLLMFLSSLGVSAEIPAEAAKSFIDGIQGRGFNGALQHLQNELGYDLSDVYSEVHARVALKKPNLVGLFILEVTSIGKYFEEFDLYYESLPPVKKRRLRQSILAEPKLDRYMSLARKGLQENFKNNQGPKFRTYMGYLDSIEAFLKKIHRELSAGLFELTPPGCVILA